MFLKVVRPKRVVALHDRHRMLVAAGVPVPQSLGYLSDGLVALQALPGVSMRQSLRDGSRDHPPGAAMVDLLDHMPTALTDLPRRPSWRDRAEHYAAVVAAALPVEARRVEELGAAIVEESDNGPVVPVHGDFYESQIHVHSGRISGLLDVDTAGPGDRIDDLACLLGHLAVLAQIDVPRAGLINQVGARYLAAFERQVDPGELRCRIAAVVLSLATGPHRVQESGWSHATRQRITLAERWLSSARLLRGEGVLTGGSGVLHSGARR